MKSLLIILLFIILTNCSFDNKSGIWTGGSVVDKKKDNQFKDFQALNTSVAYFNSLINKSKNYSFKFEKIKIPTRWNDEFYNSSNNTANFSYKNNNEIILISKKITNGKINSKILFDGKNIFTTDVDGNLIIYSINEQKIIFKYNFYKKKYKKIIKKLNIIIDNSKVYVADNIGFIYAIDYENKKLIWALNNKIPFRSNLKIFKNNLLLADQDNTIHVISKTDGKKLFNLPTTETTLKNNFINSLSLGKNSLFYLNTFGSLYSFNADNFRINWLVNINQNSEFRPGNLFYANPIIYYREKIIISSDTFLQIFDSMTGRTIYKKAITSVVKPIISGDNLFIITKDNLLVCINIFKGEIIFSINIADKIADYLETKKNQLLLNQYFY